MAARQLKLLSRKKRAGTGVIQNDYALSRPFPARRIGEPSRLRPSDEALRPGRRGYGAEVRASDRRARR